MGVVWAELLIWTYANIWIVDTSCQEAQENLDLDLTIYILIKLFSSLEVAMKKKILTKKNKSLSAIRKPCGMYICQNILIPFQLSQSRDACRYAKTYSILNQVSHLHFE